MADDTKDSQAIGKSGFNRKARTAGFTAGSLGKTNEGSPGRLSKRASRLAESLSKLRRKGATA